MANGRNKRKKRSNINNEYSIIKIISVAVILLILIIGIILLIKKISNSKNKQISYGIQNYEYFILSANNGKVGVINKKGNKIIEPIYSDIIIPNNSKDVFFCYKDEQNYEILNSRKEKILAEYKDVSTIKTFDESLLEFEKDVLKYSENGKLGLINLDGIKVTEAEYESLSSLENKPGAILAKKDNKYGVLDRSGNTIVDFKYDSIVGDNFATQENGYDKTGYITKNITKNGDLFGYIDYRGKVILDTKFESIERVNESQGDNIFLICMNRGKKGVYNGKKQIISFNFQNIYYSDNSNVFVVQKLDKYGFYNQKGKVILNPEYEKYTLLGNYISVENDGVKTLYDVNGNPLNNVQYISMMETDNPEYFIAQKDNGNYAIISKSITVDEGFAYLAYAFDNYFIYADQSGKYGVLDVWKGTVIEPKYEYILKINGMNALEAKKSNINQTDIYSRKLEIISTVDGAIVDKVDENYAVVYSNSERFYIDKNGELVLNKQVFPNNKIYSNKQNEKWGFVDLNGNKVLDPIYDFVTEVNEYGYAAIATNGVWGVIDENGNVVVEPKYVLDIYYMPEFIGEYKLETLEQIYCVEME